MDIEDCHMGILSFHCLLYMYFIPGVQVILYPSGSMVWIRPISYLGMSHYVFNFPETWSSLSIWKSTFITEGHFSCCIFCPISVPTIPWVSVILRMHHLSPPQYMCGLHYLFCFAFLLTFVVNISALPSLGNLIFLLHLLWSLCVCNLYIGFLMIVFGFFFWLSPISCQPVVLSCNFFASIFI